MMGLGLLDGRPELFPKNVLYFARLFVPLSFGQDRLHLGNKNKKRFFVLYFARFALSLQHRKKIITDMKKTLTLVAWMLVASAAAYAQSKVYLTRNISPESLVKIYKAVGVPAKGRVAVKMSTGEGSNPNYLKPELVKNLVFEVDGTIVECNTAYGNAPADKKDDRNTSSTSRR